MGRLDACDALPAQPERACSSLIWKSAVRLTIGLAILALIPIVIVIGLGAYGQSLGGASTGRTEQGAELTVLPALGRPGETLRINGSGWPPRTEIRLDFTRATRDGQTAGPPISFGGIYTSRSGTFASEVVLPESLPLPPGSFLNIRASAMRPRGAGLRAIAQFEVLGFDNELIINAVDPATGGPVDAVHIELRDRFQTVVARDVTGRDGTVRFVGLAPGTRYSALVRASGRFAVRVPEVSIPERGVSRVTANLPVAPMERFYVGVIVFAAENAIELVGIDIPAELPVRDRIELMPWARVNSDSAAGAPGGLLFLDMNNALPGILGTPGYQLEDAGEDLALAISGLQVTESLGSAGLVYEPSDGRYLGRNRMSGDLIVAMNDGLQVGIAFVNPEDGSQHWVVRLNGQFHGPYVTADSSTATLFGRLNATIVEIETTTGTITSTKLEGIEAPYRVGADYVGRWFAFSIPRGQLYRIDSDNSVTLLATMPELSNQVVRVVVGPSGAQVLLISPRDRIVYVVDTESGATTAIVPTPGRIRQVVFAGDATRLLLASREDRSVYMYSWPDLRPLNSIPVSAK